MSRFGIHCIIDPYATLSIRDNGGSDIALITERFDPALDKGNISHTTCATLRQARGGGRYDHALIGETYRDKTLHDHFCTLYREHAPEKDLIPDFKTDFDLNNWDASVPVDMLTFPSDDGRDQSFSLLKKGDYLGIMTSHGDHVSREGKDVTVWLGSLVEKPVLHAIWTRGIETYDYYQEYGNTSGFDRRTSLHPEPAP